MESPPTILLIEDNPADQEMTRRALKHANSAIELEIVDDGEQAIDYLLRRDVYADLPVASPSLVLLDLNLPKLSGKDVIREVRKTGALAHLPLIVMSTSHAEEDVLESYQLGCNSYLIKPNRFDSFVATMELVIRYWLEGVCLPKPK